LYVLEGELTRFRPDEEATLRAGDFLVAPHGTPHTYRVGEAGARWLTTSVPAGFERFVAAAGARPYAGPAELARIAAAHGIEVLGAPGVLPG
jgi:hypothetical protein